MCDVPLHIHIKRDKKRQKYFLTKMYGQQIQMNWSLATRAGKQNLLVDGWVGELQGLLN